MSSYLPRRRPPFEDSPTPGKPRKVRTTGFFWLDMSVPFTSTSGEQKVAATKPKQFPLRIRSAWTDLTSPLARFYDQASGVPTSTLPVPLLSLAGRSDLVYPQLYWRRPYNLRGNTALNGEFTNIGAEAAGKVVFFCERPDRDQEREVFETRQYVLQLDLGLDPLVTSEIQVTTQQIEYDLLVYGALSTASEFAVQFLDTQKNEAWSSSKLNIGAFAGIADGSVVQPIVYFSTPYFLSRNSQIQANITNDGGETGGFIAFLCERILPNRK